MDLSIEQLIERIETALQSALTNPHPSLGQFYGMMQYHLGWLDRDLHEHHVASRGKRVRPLLTLLACQAAGGNSLQAMPAAVAVELVHNFSLVHDDIQDRSDFRRHRETVWRVWGDAQAINAGDALFTIARMQMDNLLDTGVPAQRALSAIRALDEACLALTEGQFLDMQFEGSAPVSLDDYIWMIRGKTAALLACACQVGALVATDDTATIRALQQFGYNLGMAFQVEDDLLGIWGASQSTGKPTGDDILHRKKTLPVVFAWEHGLMPNAEPHMKSAAQFLLDVFRSKSIAEEDAQRVARILESAGAREYCASISAEYTSLALAALSQPGLHEESVRRLQAIARSLLGREH